MRLIVTGGAGFLGSHLCERLIGDGHEVICFDSLITGSARNLEPLQGRPGFSYRQHDVSEPFDIDGDLDWILHFASPASPPDYLEFPIETLKVGALGTLNGLELAMRKSAGFFLASTSEVYGDPAVNPQPEGYWGNVNPTGPRAVYDEAKRFGEAAAYGYHRKHGVPVRVARIFNTYGSRMRIKDGRAVPNFITQALRNDPITVHDDGRQTRSLCYVDDTVEGIVRLLNHPDLAEPVNLGNPEEVTVLHLAGVIRELAESRSEIVFVEGRVDDPRQRRPDITRAKSALDWEPEVSLRDGMPKTIDWFKEHLAEPS